MLKNALAFFFTLLALVVGIGINTNQASADSPQFSFEPGMCAEDPSRCEDMCLRKAYSLQYCCGDWGPGYWGETRKGEPRKYACKWLKAKPKTTGKDGRSVRDMMIAKDGHLVVQYSDDTIDDLGLVVGRDGVSGSSGLGIGTFDIDSNGHLIVTLTDKSVKDLGKVVGKDGKDSAAKLVPYLSFSFGSGGGDAVVGLGLGLELRIDKFISMVEVVGYDAPKADMLQQWRGQLTVKVGASLAKDLDLLGAISFVQESWDPLGGWSQRSAMLGADLEYRLSPYVALTFQTLFGLFYNPQQDLGSADATLWVTIGVKGRLP